MSETVTLRAPARRAAITVTQPMVPAPVISTDLPRSSPPRFTACRPTASGSANASSPSVMSPPHRVALALAHHEVFLEHPLHVREAAGAAQESHVARTAARVPRGSIRSARRRATGDTATLSPTCTRVTPAPDAGDHRRRLVPGNQRLAHDEVAVAALEVVVEIGAADAAGAEAQQHLAGADRRHFRVLDAQVFLCVDPASQHGASLGALAAPSLCQCKGVPPLRKPLVRLVEMPLHRGRAPASRRCAAIAFSTARCSAIAACHSAGES